jgi:hypothetical protein
VPAGTPAAVSSPTPAPVKLLGLVQQAGGLRAALALDGDVVLGMQGETVAGYTIETIDEDSGVVLKGSDGRRIELRPQPR